MKKEVAIIDYGAGNIQSIIFALKRIGVDTLLTNDLNQIMEADKVILPGVGHASPALSALQQNGLDELIPSLQQPVLGICLGMQLMCNFSEENNKSGLGVFSANVKKFSENEKVPHMGWNNIENTQGLLLKGIDKHDHVYYVHSYYAELGSETVAETQYGQSFSAVLRRDNFFGCQFHPEKSGSVGQRILKNFIEL